MSKPVVTLATADQIRAIVARVSAVFHDPRPGQDPWEVGWRTEARAQARACVEALRFCSSAAGMLGDPSLLPTVVTAVRERALTDDRSRDDISTIAVGLRRLLAAGVPVDDTVAALATHSNPRVRLAIADSLQPRGDAAVKLLRKLATDRVPEVRQAAKKTLASVAEMPWWGGKFTSDPMIQFSPSHAVGMKPVLEKLSTLLDSPASELRKREAEIVALGEQLPDALVVDFAATFLAPGERTIGRHTELGRLMLSRDGGAAALVRLAEAWSRSPELSFMDAGVATWLKALPDELCERVCRELLARLAVATAKERQVQGGAPSVLAAAVGLAWPAGADLTALLDVALACVDDEDDIMTEADWVASGLQEAFVGPGADPQPIAARTLAARLANYPGAFGKLAMALDQLLERAPLPELRLAAERAILSDDSNTLEWGLSTLLLRARDDTRDPPPIEMVRRFLGEPRYREAILDSADIRPAAASLLREDLRAGRLPVIDAVRVLRAISQLYGGLVTPGETKYRRSQPDSERETGRAAIRARFEAFLGRPQLHGPVTEEDLAPFRAARAALPATDRATRRRALMVLPNGPWQADDRAFFAELLRAFDTDADLAVPITRVLQSQATLDDVALFDHVLRGAPRESRPLVRHCLRDTRERLGLPRNPPTPAEGAPQVPLEWMDEPED